MQNVMLDVLRFVVDGFILMAIIVPLYRMKKEEIIGNKESSDKTFKKWILIGFLIIFFLDFSLSFFAAGWKIYVM